MINFNPFLQRMIDIVQSQTGINNSILIRRALDRTQSIKGAIDLIRSGWRDPR